jgi:peroxiredoxin
VTAAYPDIRALGGEVLAVSFSPPAKVAAYVARHPLPFPAVSDPDRQGYRAFLLARTTWRTFFRPAVLGRYLRLMFKGWMPRREDPEADLLQLGGDFVLDARRRVVLVYRSADPTDRPPARQLVEAVRRATGSP